MILKKNSPSLLAIQNHLIFEVSISLFGEILPGKKRLILPCLLPPGHYPILSDCAIYYAQKYIYILKILYIYLIDY
jgi:hypothetical protein